MFRERPSLARPKKKQSNQTKKTGKMTPVLHQPNVAASSIDITIGITRPPLPRRPDGIAANRIYNSHQAAATTTTFPTAWPNYEQYPNVQPNYEQYSNVRPSAPISGQFAGYSVPFSEAVYQPLARATDDILHGPFSQAISSKLNSVITAIDEETFSGEERDLVVHFEQPPTTLRGGGNLNPFSRKTTNTSPYTADRAITSSLATSNVFHKASLYANSKFPANLQTLQLFLPAHRLLCLAAQYSRRAYSKPSNGERDAFIGADWRLGTKAMVIKSAAVDESNTIVFAIRGSQTFMDWAVNLHMNPESPQGFLDDVGNLCHEGFLSVARKMIAPVAARLRSLLEENPRRSTCSLLMTGHSAGGAVASLLYAHMLAETAAASSELNTLTGCFRRIHCVTFGTPPVSLLPLTKPRGEKFKKNLFMSFINEGDPVPRADPAYVRSLLRLYASPAPGNGHAVTIPELKLPCKRQDKANKVPLTAQDFVWEVPPGTLSTAGRLVGLKGEAGKEVATGKEEDVSAKVMCDFDLRSIVFGDPVMHSMRVYARRIEVLATKAVTGGLWQEG